PAWLLAALALMVAQVFVCAFRWRAVLKVYDNPLSYSQAFRFFYIGTFFNQALPASVGGDAIRSYRAYKSGMALGQSVGSVFLDRIATVLALIFLVAAMVPFVIDGMSGNIQALKFSVIALLVLGVGGTVFLMFLDRVPDSFKRFRVVHHLAVFAGDVRKVFLSPSTAVPLMFWAILGHINLSLVVWVLSLSIGVNISLVDCLALFPLVLLIQTMPISIAGWGVREGAMVEVFAMAGVLAPGALAVSLLFGIVAAVSSLPGGWLWISSREHNLEEAEVLSEMDMGEDLEIEAFEQSHKN
ncbi:MAG: flippase-like domain-containing protein, partial [Rhodospirillaceae bacterium]|nr:flippase-like domain-containing protein [Rhodospirillaceae bacterium]